MKKYRSISLLVLIGLISICSVVGAAPEKELWRQVVVAADVSKCAVHYAGFQNENYGVTVGYAGEVHYTNDGGKSWPRADNTSLCRWGLDIIDDKIAWNCGTSGHVRLTKDGGKHWKAVSDFGLQEPDQCRYISFLDDRTGWNAAPGLLGATADGGKSWTKIAIPKGAGNIAAISLRTASNGYLLDEKGTLFVTQDGGGSWTVKRVKFTEPFAISKAPSAAIRFITADKGIIVYSSLLGTTFAMITRDGGNTWTQEKVIDDSGLIYLTHDGIYLTITAYSMNEVSVFKREESL